jgi:hypothetical protein
LVLPFTRHDKYLISPHETETYPHPILTSALFSQACPEWAAWEVCPAWEAWEACDQSGEPQVQVWCCRTFGSRFHCLPNQLNESTLFQFSAFTRGIWGALAPFRFAKKRYLDILSPGMPATTSSSYQGAKAPGSSSQSSRLWLQSGTCTVPRR